jgi:TonB family protein
MLNWTLLVSLTLKSTVILMLAWIAAFALRRRSAAARHIVWTAAWAALLALPLLSLSLPNWPNRLANSVLPIDSGVTFEAHATAARGTGPVTSPERPATPTHGGTRSSFDARRALALAWMAGALIAWARMLAAYAAISRLRQTARPSALGMEDAVPVLVTPGGIPMTAGILSPAIFLPAESAAWSVERLRMVLAHERAHILRGDAATQLLARTALCLVWFHPLAWIAWREFLKERERAADDLVLATGALPSDYAGHLLEVARTMQSAPVHAAAGVCMARRSQLEGRLLAILDSRVKRAQPRRATIALSLLAALALAVPLATVRAQSQAERDAPPNVDATIAAANARNNYEMLDQAAASYERLRQYPEAQRLREASLAIRKQAGVASPVYAEGLVKLGDLARKRNASADAAQYYMQAVAVGDMPETVPALINLGLHAYSGHDVQTAKDYFQRARNAAKSGNDIGRAMTWLAVTERSDPASVGEAESLLRTALTIEDVNSADQALTSEVLASILRSEDRAGEAEPLQEQARAIRRNLAADLSSHISAVSSQVRRVGNGVSAPKLTYKVEPEYSEAARAMKIQGTVLLTITIDTDGLAKDIQVVRGTGMGLDEKAVEAVSLWRFAPGTADGVPVPVKAQIEVNFRLL